MSASAHPRRMMTARARGAAVEDLVAARLAGLDWSILGRNVRFGRDELDIVAVDPGPPRTLVIVEVRWRSRRDFGYVEETFDRAKRSRIRRALGSMLEAGRLPDGTLLPRLALRVDLVVVEPGASASDRPRVRHHRTALGAD